VTRALVPGLRSASTSALAFALVALGSVVAPACVAEVSLGTPPVDAGSPPPPQPVVCVAGAVRTELPLDPALGGLRALAAHGTTVVGAFARPDGAGVVAWSERGGPFVEVARVGADPSAIALDGAYAYVACRGSAAVHRVRAGDNLVATNQRDVASVAVDGDGSAFWTSASLGVVREWRAADGGLAVVDRASVPFGQAIAERAGTLYVSGAGALEVIGASGTVRHPACGPGALVAMQGAVICLEGESLRRVALPSGAITTLASSLPAASQLVVARGRAFVPVTPAPGSPGLMSVPLDGVGGPTRIDDLPRSPHAVAADACAVYYPSAEAAAVVRLPL